MRIHNLYVDDKGETHFRDIEVEWKHEGRGGTFEDRTIHKPHVLGRDGRRYTVELLYQINPESHGAWEPPADFRDELLWRGKLTTAPLEFEVSAR